MNSRWISGPAFHSYGATAMDMIWPAARRDVDPVALHAAEDRRHLAGRPWVALNMITTVDGAAADAQGLSGNLGGPGDRAVFSALRGVADIIVAGAATVVAENYGPSRPRPEIVAQRIARGQQPRPRIAVVTASLAIDPDSRLFGEATDDARPLVLTTATADPTRRRALEAVADVHTAGDYHVDWPAAVAVLGDLGAEVVLCEGGPRTNAGLIAHDLVDEMCVTVAPALVAGPATRIVHGPAAPAPRGLALDRVLVDEGFLFLRYTRARPVSGASVPSASSAG